MFGTFRIEPTTSKDLPELGWFLCAGFGLPTGSEGFTEDVLRWKYFDRFGAAADPRSDVARVDGRIVGHIGIVHRAFHIRQATTVAVPTVHFTDWLAGLDQPSAGLVLMLHGSAATQYAIGGSPHGQRMARTVGYEPVSTRP